MSPTDIPLVKTPSVDEDAVTLMHRTRTFAKKTFVRVGVPVLIGTAAYLVAKKLDGQTVDLSAITE